MPGIPTSQRCLYCKKRKIKCDLRWPRCTQCEHAGVECSGPTVTTKFIHARGDTLAATDHTISDYAVLTRRSPESHLNEVKSPPAPRGRHGQFRLSFDDHPRPYPTTVAGRVAARLVKMMDKDVGGLFSVKAKYMQYLPERLGSSTALCDSVNLFCVSWSVSKTTPHLSSSPAVSSAYGKALRSLGRALQKPDSKYSCETLAAVTVIARSGMLFDCDNQQRPWVHGPGMASLMKSRGPPNGDDELDVELAKSNFNVLATHWAARDINGGAGPDSLDPWMEAIGWKLPGGGLNLGADSQDAFLNYCMGIWPSFIEKIKSVCSFPDDQEEEMQSLAEETRHDIKGLHSQAFDVCSSLLDEAWDSDVMISYSIDKKFEDDPLPKSDSPQSRTSLPPDHMEWLQLVVAVTVLDIVFTRMDYDLTAKLQCSKGAIGAAYERYMAACQQSWGMIPHLRSLGPTVGMLCITPIYISFEAAKTEAGKTHLIDFIKSTSAKKLLPDTREHTELWLANIARLITGRELLVGKDGNAQSVAIWKTTN